MKKKLLNIIIEDDENPYNCPQNISDNEILYQPLSLFASDYAHNYSIVQKNTI